MIHVDVRRSQPEGRDVPDFSVETSIEGGPWKAHYLFSVTEISGFSREEATNVAKSEAENAARVFSAGIEFATGQRPRMTSCGYSL